MTSKLQLTLPKAIADQYGIRPGDELQWVPAGEVIRVIPGRAGKLVELERTPEERVDLFDRATERQRRREVISKKKVSRSATSGGRGWTREDLYHRGRAD